MLTDTLRLRKPRKILKKINKLAPQMRKMSDAQLQNQTQIFRELLKKGKTLEDILPEAFATVREADYRVLGLYPYDVQVLGAIMLSQGSIAEMKTGEGKTLVATMPLYLNGLTGKGAMLVTPNGYLAARDEKDLAPVYKFLGLTVSLAFLSTDDEEQKATPQMKRKWYASDITYTTASSLAFDYLFNNLSSTKDRQYLRPFNFVIIDEVDQVLLDEAESPFVVSSKPSVQSNLYGLADQFVNLLDSEKDYEFRKDDGVFWLTAHGIEKAERFFKLKDLFDEQSRAVYRHIVLAMTAHLIMRKGHDYLVVKGKVILLDEDSGRLKRGVQVSTGLHQAIEAKEKVELTNIQKTAASITFPALFSLFNKVSGMSGTAKVNEEEFLDIYNLKVTRIPTNRPVIRKDKKPVLFLTTRDKLMAAIDYVVKLHQTGRPVLLVAGSVENSEIISELLLNMGIPHNVLNAYSVAYEAQIVKRAGQKGEVTIATNMAGRGTDIKLGKGVKELGGLAVIGTEMLPKRVELQLAGRAGRQGDPGLSQFFISLEDDFVSSNNTGRQKKYYRRLMRKKQNGKDLVTLKSPITKFSLHMLRDRVAAMSALQRTETNKGELILSLQRKNYYDMRDRVMAKKDLQADIDQAIDRGIELYFKKEKIKNKNDLKYFINEHVTYNKVILPEDLENIQDYKKYLHEIINKVINQKKKTLINKEQLNNFYRQIMIAAMDGCWIDEVDKISKLKIEAHGWTNSGRPQDLLQHQAAFKMYLQFWDKITLAIFDNLLLSQININEKGQLVVVFN